MNGRHGWPYYFGKLQNAYDRKLKICRGSAPFGTWSGYLITEFIHELLVEFFEPRYDCWYFVLRRQDRASEVPCSRDLKSITRLKSNRNHISASSMMLGIDKYFSQGTKDYQPVQNQNQGLQQFLWILVGV